MERVAMIQGQVVAGNHQNLVSSNLIYLAHGELANYLSHPRETYILLKLPMGNMLRLTANILIDSTSGPDGEKGDNGEITQYYTLSHKTLLSYPRETYSHYS